MTQSAPPSPPPVAPRLGLGILLNDTFRFVFENFVKTVVLCGTPLLPLVLLIGALSVSGIVGPGDLDALFEETVRGGVPAILIVFGLLIFMPVMTYYAIVIAGMTKAVFDARYGPGTHLGDAFSTALSRFWPVFGAALACAMLMFVAALPGIIFALISGLFGMLILMATLLVVTVLIQCAIPIATFERPAGGTVSHSISLTKPYFWPCLGGLTVVVLVTEVVGTALGYVAQSIGEPFYLAIAIEILIAIVQTAFYASFAAHLYCRLSEMRYGPPAASDAEIFA